MTVKQSTQLRLELTVAYNDYKRMLNAHAHNKVNDMMLSEDLVQQAFMKTWIYLVKRGRIDLMKAFLFHVLNNLIIDEYRKHKTTSLDVIMENGAEPKVINPQSSLDNYIDGKNAMLQINNLPEKYKKILQLRYVQNLSPKEIRDITGQSKNCIAVQSHRGLEKLKILCNY